ncbi:MAG: hypothetical protein ACK4GU_15240 [Alishewanella aestuarii]
MSAIPAPNVIFTVADRGGEYFAKLQQLAAAVDTSIAAYNLAVAAGVDAGSILGEVQALQEALNAAIADGLSAMQQQGAEIIGEAIAIRDATQMISESGLPSTAGAKYRALTVGAAGIEWAQVSGFNALIEDASTLSSGARALVLVDVDTPISLPETVAELDNFFIKNSQLSGADALITLPVAALGPNDYEMDQGDVLRLRPGEKVSLTAVSTELLELTL